MKSKSLRFVVLFFVFCLVFVILQSLIVNRYSVLSASVPQLISYQGKVTGVDGVGITDTLDISFSLWNAATDGDSLWSETQLAVPIIKGLFDVQLGSVNPIALSFDTTYFLQIIVDGDKLLPRIQLSTSPYAFRAKFADSVVISTNKDTIWSADEDPSDTIVIMAQTKIHGELIADSIQAVGDNIVIDDHLGIYGCASFFGGLTDVIYTEGFESGDPPAGWEEVDATGTADLSYVITSQHPNGFSPTEGAVMVEFNSFDCGAENQITLQQTTGFSTTGYTSITVSVDMLHDTGFSFYDDLVELSCSRDGVIWIIADTLHRVDGSTGWKTETIILPDSMSTRPTIYLSLKFISDYGNNVYIDNLIVTGVAFDTLELARICDGDGYFYGDVTANSFIGNGSNLTGLDDLDWSKNGNYLFPFNTSDSVVIGGTTAYDKLDVAGSMTIRGDNLNLPHGNTLVSNLESIRMAGVAADYIISLQDGSGRIQHYWNSTTGNPGPNRYLATGEPAWMWDVTVFADPYMEFKYAPADTEGHDITWITHMAIESSGNIGIGTTTPSEKLDVFGKTRTTDFQMTGGATDGFVLQSDPAGNASWVDPESLAIENDGDWTLSGTDMYSAVSGNVGVGISEPAAKLHVAVDNCDSVSSPPFQDGFEDGTLAPFTADAHPWFVTSESVSEGTKSARSGGITDNQITNMELTLTTEPGRISFDRRVFSEPNADYLRFYIDGVLKDSWAGDLDWYSYSYPVTGGSHTFRWSYQKDISDAWYYDCAWIDNVQCIDTTYEIDCASDYALYADGKNLTPAGIFINGNMGIGTTTPSTQLDVIGDAIFSGMVGVGTSSPSTQLDVNGNAVFSGKVGVGTSSPDPSAALDISSTSSGFVIPRLTTAQRDAIANPTQSLMVYNTTTKCLQIWENNFEWYDIWCVPPWVGVCGENTIIDVTNPATGDTWMDRNLGASRQATAYNDYMAYGALFQWGRLSDGHECINWTSSSAGNPVNDSTHTTSSTDDPGHSLFIATGFPNDWRVPRNDLLWRGIHGINNPCPPGYRLPTETELDNELLSWSASGPYGSPLKLVSAGERFANDSDLHYTGYNGSLWSSTTSEVSVMVLHFEGSTYLIASSMRGHGRCVRCIKD